MIADIAVGHHAGADVLFLIASILAGLAGILAAIGTRPRRVADGTVAPTARPEYAWSPVLGWLAVCALAVAWLIL